MPRKSKYIKDGLGGMEFPNIDGLLLKFPYKCSDEEFIHAYQDEKAVGLWISSRMKVRKHLGTIKRAVLEKIGKDVKYLFTEEVENIHDFYCCKNLEKLWFRGIFKFNKLKKNPLDFREFPKLKILRALTLKGNHVIGLDGCQSIEELSSSVNFLSKSKWHLPNLKILNQSRSKEPDFQYLINFPALEELNHTFCEVQNLEGIHYAKNLKKLSIVYAKKLLDISSVSGTNLHEFHIVGAPNIKNHELIAEAKKINSLMLQKCGKIKSMNKISTLKYLEFLNFYYTTVIDGDLSSLAKRKWKPNYIGFFDKPHYSHKLQDFVGE